MLSFVLIIPAALADTANALGEAMGWGPGSYSVPLSANGLAPASHYGLHTWAEQSFADMLEAAGTGTIPPELAAAGYPAQDFAAVLAGLIVSVRDDSVGHWQDAIAGVGLIMEIGEQM